MQQGIANWRHWFNHSACMLPRYSIPLFTDAGQLLIVMVVPFKWLLRTHVQPLGTTPTAPKSWSQRFRHHLQQCLLEHPTVKTAAYLWTGTAIFNAWLRALGTKVGKQAWIGEVSGDVLRSTT
jgi:hypothetical protein